MPSFAVLTKHQSKTERLRKPGSRVPQASSRNSSTSPSVNARTRVAVTVLSLTEFPPAESAFLHDQRTVRKLNLGSVDYKETGRRRRTDERRRKLRETEKRGTPKQANSPDVSETSEASWCASGGAGPSGMLRLADSTHASIDDDTVPVTDDSDTSDGEWRQSERQTEENNDVLSHTALAADRYRQSNRAVAAVVNGFQKDIGRLSSSNTIHAVDQKKIWRERCRMRHASAEQRDEQHRRGGVKALYFDGRHDQTLETHGSSVRAEEHIAIVAEPGSEYISHFTPISGRAIDQFNELVSIATGYGDPICVLGCDGAAVNTGRSGGVCRLFELIQGKPVH